MFVAELLEHRKQKEHIVQFLLIFLCVHIYFLTF